jgi:hypothetical protein
MGGLDTRSQINSPLHVRHIEHAGRHVQEGPVHLRRPHQPGRRQVLSGECAMFSGSRRVRRRASRRRPSSSGRSTSCPTTTTSGAPQNSIIGGAQLWVMGGKKPASTRAWPSSSYLSKPEVQMEWHTSTATCRSPWPPTTDEEVGLLREEPGHRHAHQAAHQQAPTANSKGLRFGNFVQGRTVIEEELETCSPARRTPRRRWTTPSSAATRSCASSRRRTSKPLARGCPRRRQTDDLMAEKRVVSARRGCRMCWWRRRLAITIIFFFWPAGRRLVFVPAAGRLRPEDEFVGLRTSRPVRDEPTTWSLVQGHRRVFSVLVAFLGMSFRCCWR